MNMERKNIIMKKMSHHLSEDQKRDVTDIFNSIFNKVLINQSHITYIYIFNIYKTNLHL